MKLVKTDLGEDENGDGDEDEDEHEDGGEDEDGGGDSNDDDDHFCASPLQSSSWRRLL